MYPHLPERLTRRHPSFFWEYFAETPEEWNIHLTTFWNGVKKEVGNELAKLVTNDNLTSFSKTFDIGGKLNDAFTEFRKQYLRLGYSADPNFSILLFFDEARHLCQTTAFNGRKIYTIQEFMSLTKDARQKLVNSYIEDGFSCFWHCEELFARPKRPGKLIPAPDYLDCLQTLCLALGIFNHRNRMTIPSVRAETLSATSANYSFPLSIVLRLSMQPLESLRILFRT